MNIIIYAQYRWSSDQTISTVHCQSSLLNLNQGWGEDNEKVKIGKIIQFKSMRMLATQAV